MGLPNRWMTLLRANINDRIDRAEDPAKMLDHLLFEMRSQLVEAKKAVCIAIADERALQRRAEHHGADAAAWEQRAMLAIRAGHDELARAALLRKRDQDEIAQSYQAQWFEQKRSVEALRQALAGLQLRIDEAARQRTMLAARLARAQAQRSIATTLANLQGAADGMSAFSTFERLEQKVVQLEAEADAMAEIGGSETLSLEQQFRALAARSVDDELVALKQRMALAAPAPVRALPG
ncbi:MAG: PspA/IM30 family protein [Nannocystaceae bacterium]